MFFYCIWHTSWTLSCNLGNRWWRIKFLIYDWLSLYQYNQKEAYENPSDPLFYVIEIGFGLWVLGPIANTLQCSIWQLHRVPAPSLQWLDKAQGRSACVCVAKLWLTLISLPCHKTYGRKVNHMQPKCDNVFKELHLTSSKRGKSNMPFMDIFPCVGDLTTVFMRTRNK